MFAFIRGELISSNPLYAVVEANGIGYKIYLAVSGFSKLPQIGKAALLYTSFVVREQSQALYGFLTSEERDCFESLLNVSGIGPKLALSIIGHLSLSDLKVAVKNEDIAVLSKVPGIGKKSAERLIIELRDKLPEIPVASLTLKTENSQIKDAISALINLGYNQSIAQKAIKKSVDEASSELDLTMLITTALKHI